MSALFQKRFRISSSRLPGWDYREPGIYFVTICTKEMRCYFGEVMNGKVDINNAGNIAQKNWLSIPSHHNNVITDAFIVMPNHIHGILILTEMNTTSTQIKVVETLHATSLRGIENEPNSESYSKISPRKGSLSTIIRSFKSSTTRRINQLQNAPFSWQPRFYDHVIRTEDDLLNLREYIRLNPEKWNGDNSKIKSISEAMPNA